MIQLFEKGKAKGRELINVFKNLPPVDIILSEFMLMRDVRPLLKNFRDISLIYSNTGGPGDFIARPSKNSNQQVKMSAFKSGGQEAWTLSINATTKKSTDNVKDVGLDDFQIEVRNGKPTKFIVGKEIFIADGDFSNIARSNRLQTITLLKAHLMYVGDRLSEELNRPVVNPKFL